MILFFDTSSLVRRYHVTEPGAGSVRRLCRRAEGKAVLILAVTSVEIASAFNRKLREGTVDRRQRDRMWRQFLVHRRAQYRSIPLEEEIYQRAERLLFRHALRTYDAIQLAGALHAQRSLAQTGEEFRFCTADRNQAAAARAEGLSVEFIG